MSAYLPSLAMSANRKARFCTCLDGSKTGLAIDQGVLESDIKKYGRRAPAWAETPEEAQRADNGSNDVNPKRPESLHGFIMDTLRRKADRAMKHYMSEFEKKIGSTGSAHNFASVAPQVQTHDAHLTAKYERAREKAERLQEMGVNANGLTNGRGIESPGSTRSKCFFPSHDYPTCLAHGLPRPRIIIQYRFENLVSP